MSSTVDVAVVGGGILGLAFAWEAARRGNSVAVFERDHRAQGASIPNFGMVWPIGQPAGALYQLALRSRERWLELSDILWIDRCGSVHAVYEEDEDAVIREFAALSPTHGIACEYVPGRVAASRLPALRPEGLKGVLWSDTELAIDPRQALVSLPRWLAEQHRVQFRYGTAVTAVETGRLATSTGEVCKAARIFVAAGIDFQTLFPEAYATLGLRICKLQMLRTAQQPASWKLGPHLAGELTPAHYQSFEACRSLASVKARIAAEMLEYLHYGIHVKASQNELGEVLIGDSHEHDADMSVFDNPRIDELILRYLLYMLRLPDATIAARWHGLYAKNPSNSLTVLSPQPGVTLLAAPGGTGMTLSFGFARDWWDARERDPNFAPEATRHGP